jgi:hypothetical protein
MTAIWQHRSSLRSSLLNRYIDPETSSTKRSLRHTPSASVFVRLYQQRKYFRAYTTHAFCVSIESLYGTRLLRVTYMPTTQAYAGICRHMPACGTTQRSLRHTPSASVFVRLYQPRKYFCTSKAGTFVQVTFLASFAASRDPAASV